MKRSGASVVVAIVGFAILFATPAGASTKSQLHAKALALANFPTGWSVDHDSTGGGATDTACLKNLKTTGKHDTKITVMFKGGSTVPALKEDLETGPSSQATYRRFTGALAGCTTFSFSSGGQTYHGSIGAMSFPTLGTRSAAYAVSFTAQGIEAGIDIVAFEAGHDVGDIIYEDVGTPDVGQVQAYATEAVNKVEGMPTVTPTTF